MLSEEFGKLDSIIQELRRENQMLKQTNEEMEGYINHLNGLNSEEKVRIL